MLKRTTTALALGTALGLAGAATAEETAGAELGTLTCEGPGGFGAIITSEKQFACTFDGAEEGLKSDYSGVIRKYGIDIGKTGETTLTWLVLAPGTSEDYEFSPDSLAGTYVGAGAEATAGVGVGANALIGSTDESFTLQPVSVQVQDSGLNIAAGVQTLELTFTGSSI